MDSLNSVPSMDTELSRRARELERTSTAADADRELFAMSLNTGFSIRSFQRSLVVASGLRRDAAFCRPLRHQLQKLLEILAISIA